MGKLLQTPHKLKSRFPSHSITIDLNLVSFPGCCHKAQRDVRLFPEDYRPIGVSKVHGAPLVAVLHNRTDHKGGGLPEHPGIGKKELDFLSKRFSPEILSRGETNLLFGTLSPNNTSSALRKEDDRAQTKGNVFL